MKFGIRPVVILGGFFIFAGFLLSSYAQNIEQLFIYMGFIMGEYFITIFPLFLLKERIIIRA